MVLKFLKLFLAHHLDLKIRALGTWLMFVRENGGAV